MPLPALARQTVDAGLTGFEWAVAPEARLIVGDIGDYDLVVKLLRDHKIDSVIHFAGSIVVPDA